jgi:release factor glutamine methyltransferase
LEGLREPRILDVGVGFGAIALAIAEEHPDARVLAVDRSAAALDVARENLAGSSVNGRVELRRSDLLAGISGPFDLVVSNPPYVAPEELESLEPELRREPAEALVGVGRHQAVAQAAAGVLRPGGSLVLEFGDGQACDVAPFLVAFGYRDVRVSDDLAGRQRIADGVRR